MEKPKITEGEWRAVKVKPIGFAEYEIHFSEDGECVAEIVHGEANAKAISSVPEMIDALMDAFSWINGDTIIPAELGAGRKAEDALLKRIESALKKAGAL